MKDCVEHFAEGSNCRKFEILDFLKEKKYEIISGVLPLITMGVPFWWPNSLPKSLEFNVNKLLFGTALFFGGTASGVFFLLRRREQRALNIKRACHLLAHSIRDEQNKIYRRVTESSTASSLEDDQRLYDYCDILCNNVAQYFTALFPTKKIAASIRLAVESVDYPSKVVFSTFGRSTGLSSNRASTTEDIPSNQGIPRFFNEIKNHGILIYNDIKAASSGEKPTYKMTANDNFYKDEIITMMVAPLNGWDKKKTMMIGILYVTSRYKGVFNAKHIDAMRFAADIVALSVAFTVNTLKNCDRIKNIKRRDS